LLESSYSREATKGFARNESVGKEASSKVEDAPLAIQKELHKH